MKRIQRTFAVYNHQGKANRFIEALQLFGFRLAGRDRAQVILIDVDQPATMERHKEDCAKGNAFVFCYPHAGRPCVTWDGISERSDWTSASFVHAEGHVDVLRAYGYDKPLHVSGWPYSPVLPFTPVKSPRKILYAPVHPNSNGWMPPVYLEQNKEVFERLVKLRRDGKIQLRVRYIRGLENNGLSDEPDVEYVLGEPDLVYQDILDADVVVSSQTFGYMAVALGKPTLMYGESTPPQAGSEDNNLKVVKSFDKYRDLMAFPLDLLERSDTMGLIRHAAATDESIREWKRRMIGGEFDRLAVARAICGYLP